MVALIGWKEVCQHSQHTALQGIEPVSHEEVIYCFICLKLYSLYGMSIVLFH